MAAWRHGQAAAQQFSVSPVSPFGAIFRSIVVQCERHGLLPDVSRSLSFCILGIAGSVSKSHRPVEYEGLESACPVRWRPRWASSSMVYRQSG